MPVLAIACLNAFLSKCLLVLMLTLPEYLPIYLSSYQSGYLLAYCTSMVVSLPTKLTLSERPAFLLLWKSSSLDICLSGNCPYGWLLPYLSG
jgi:hypothetical protein